MYDDDKVPLVMETSDFFHFEFLKSDNLEDLKGRLLSKFKKKNNNKILVNMKI